RLSPARASRPGPTARRPSAHRGPARRADRQPRPGNRGRDPAPRSWHGSVTAQHRRGAARLVRTRTANRAGELRPRGAARSYDRLRRSTGSDPREPRGTRSRWDQIREPSRPTCRGSTLITFSDLGVVPEIADTLDAVGITHPFPIQEMTLPIALLGADVIGQARPGTGKTLAFGVPLLQRIVSPLDRAAFADLAAPGKPQALVVVPTRELALQVAGDLKLAGAKIGTRVLTVYGGRAYEPQIEALVAGVEVVVGTPGGLLDLADQGRLDLSHVKVLVLDEADEMLDLG